MLQQQVEQLQHCEFKIHTFTGPGTFVFSAGNPAGSNTVDYIGSSRWWWWSRI